MAPVNSPAVVNWLSTFAIAIAVSLIIAGVISVVSGRLLGLAPEHKLWAFIVGFGFLAALSTAPLSSGGDWSEAIFLFLMPLLFTLVYFLPTAVAVNAGHPEFHAIFVLNLFFGWTVVGWVVALGWALRHQKVEQKVTYRITPFGAVVDDKPHDNPSKSV